MDLSDADRRRLLGLQRRVHAMVQPLNFLLLWSKHRDYRVQQVVLGAQELLFDIYSFIECFASDESPRGSQAGPKRRGGSSSSLTKSEQLDFFLRELDFTCMSVNMAICMEGATASTGCLGDVSPLALLRAHRRIKEMQGRSGHLCTLTGCLYQDLDGSGLETDSDGCQSRAEEWRNHWTPALSLATFKVVAKLASERRYHLEVESRLPLSQGDLPFVPRSDEETALAVGLNSFTRMEFPIRTACRATLLTTGHLRLATASTPTGPQDTLVDSLALVWDQEEGDLRDLSQPKKGRRFAFVFDGRNSGGDREASGIVPELALTPLDAIFLARLCAVDADAESEFAALHKTCRERHDGFRGVSSSGNVTGTGLDVSAARLILRDAVSPTHDS